MCVANKIRLCRDHPCYRIADVYIQHNKQCSNPVEGGGGLLIEDMLVDIPKIRVHFMLELARTIILNRF